TFSRKKREGFDRVALGVSPGERPRDGSNATFSRKKQRTGGTPVPTPSKAKKFGEKRFADKKFGSRKFADKKSGERKYGEKPAFAGNKSGDKKFGERPAFAGKKYGRAEGGREESRGKRSAG